MPGPKYTLQRTGAEVAEAIEKALSLENTTITGVSGSVTASKATAGNAISVATAGTAVTVAKKAASATTVGNADVGTEISITGVSGSVTASKAKAGTAIPVATTGTAKDVVTGLNTSATKVDVNHDAYTASYEAETECLILAAADITATPTIKFNTTSVTPAVSSGTITPYTFDDVTVPQAAASATKFTPATTSKTTIYGVGDTVNITPAVANGTITPYTFENVTVPKAATSATTVVTGDVD